MLGLGLPVDGLTLGADGDVLTTVALAWGHESQGTVVMDLVVPEHEPGDPFAGLVEVVAGLVREARVVFQSLEQGLGVRVVIAD